MVHMLKEETSLRDQGRVGTGSLMTSFVRALDTREKADAVPKKRDFLVSERSQH